MNTYEFALILSDSIELTDDVADVLFEAGCDDGTPGTSNGIFTIDFHRRANSLEDAIRSAIEDVQSAGLSVARVVMESTVVAETGL